MSQPVSSSLQISEAITKLRQLTQVDVQAGWRCYPGDLLVSEICQDSILDWQPTQLNEKRYITWSAGQQVWLAQRFIIPYNLQDYPLAGLSLRLVLTWWAQKAQIFVNGQLVQEGDLFDSSARILLTSCATPGETIIVALRLVSPGHDIGALMQSRCVYEETGRGEEFLAMPNAQCPMPIEPGFVADELTVLQQYLEASEPEKLKTLAAAIAQINWGAVADAIAFERSLSQLRQVVLPLAAIIQQHCIHLLGHAHLDMAWLWTATETYEVAQRTFTSVLNLQQGFPNLTFCHSTPALYAWIEEHRPDLFKAIQAAVACGSWEVVGGMWIEPEVNLPSGEALVRHLLYGQRYTQEKFGTTTKVAWLPDSFGFSWQLPQLFKESGIEYFVTGKLHWNDSTTFPHGVFWWQSPDGSRVLTLMSPPNLAGVMDTNPVIMASYALSWNKQTGLKDAFWLPGVGDHGGGPSRDMLEVQQKAAQSPFFPAMKFTTAAEYLQKISQAAEGWGDGESIIPNNLQPSTQFPTWNNELYLELHRGCYTTHADQKRFNRHCENLLYQAELWASLATISTSRPYPKAQLESAWKKVLFNQFHDILPGTSIAEVFVEANREWQAVEQVGTEILAESLEAIASQICLPTPPHPSAQPLLVFNSLNWSCSENVACPLPSEGNWAVYSLEGQLPSQRCDRTTLLFSAADIPAVGYRLFWLCKTEASEDIPKPPEQFVLENEKLRVVVNPETGDLSSVYDKINRREVIRGAGNQLQAFQDRGQYWDAWNIDPNYAQYPLPPTQLQSIQWLESGPIQWRVRVVRQLNQSQFCQDYILQAGSPLLKIATTVDWQERHVLVKAAFPLTIESDSVACEIPCGTIERSTKPQTAAEAAKWEIPALRWIDLTSDRAEYGVSLLSECKYGYDSQPNQLRLTLLRGSVWPDPLADRGVHQFTYALYPHLGGWQSAKTVQLGYQMNIPLRVLPVQQALNPTLPTVGQLLNLHSENLVLMALKQSEDHPQLWVLRCYECHGEETQLRLGSDLKLEISRPINLLEHQAELKWVTDEPMPVQPWKIVSLLLKPNLR